MKIKFALFFLLLICGSQIYATNLTEAEINGLKRIEVVQHIQYQTYIQIDQGPAGVIGYYFDRYFTQNAFGTLGIFGAVTGKRGGYGIAGLGVGYRCPINDRISLDFRSLVGSGGGGGVPAGGGFAVIAGTGLIIKISDYSSFDAGYSWLKFPSGTLETPVIHFGIALKSDQVSI